MDQASDDDEVLEPVVKQADYLSKCGFPELELDMQPNAMIPHAIQLSAAKVGCSVLVLMI